MNRAAKIIFLAGLASACTSGACGGRPTFWDQRVPPGTSSSYGLANGVVAVDDVNHRVLWLTARPDQQLAEQFLPIGHNVLGVTSSPDAKRLFVLAGGDSPRRTAGDELPSLTVIDGSTFTASWRRYTMSVPLGGLAVDPEGNWAVAYNGGTKTTSFVQNENEFVIFDLTKPPGTATAPNPVSRTIQSFGGTPQLLTFTPELALPEGKRRLLLIETNVDLTMLDLNHAFDATPRPEITVQLTNGDSSREVNPAGIAVDGRDEADPNDARIALWASNDSNVYTMALVPSTSGPNDFAPTINLTDVGGIPSSVAFVRTSPSGIGAARDSGLRVAALVPSTSRAVLVQPDTSVTTTVALSASYSSLSLVTDVVAPRAATGVSGTDVALLWNAGVGAASGVALWTLGNSVGQPYRSIEVLGATQPVNTAQAVPTKPNLEVLQMTSGAGFYVLDLLAQRVLPLATSEKATLSLAPGGHRVWAFSQGGTDLAAIDLQTLNPVPLTTDLPIDAVYEVARAGFDGVGDGGYAAIALHARGTLGATVFDATAPDTVTSRRAPALLLEGP